MIMTTTPLTPDELLALDRKVASLSRELAEVASLLVSRYGDTGDLAVLARGAQADFVTMSHQLHRMALAARADTQVGHRSRIA